MKHSVTRRHIGITNIRHVFTADTISGNKWELLNLH